MACFGNVIEHATEVSFIHYKWIEASNLMAILVISNRACFIAHHFLFISSTKHQTTGEEFGKQFIRLCLC